MTDVYLLLQNAVGKMRPRLALVLASYFNFLLVLVVVFVYIYIYKCFLVER